MGSHRADRRTPSSPDPTTRRTSAGGRRKTTRTDRLASVFQRPAARPPGMRIGAPGIAGLAIVAAAGIAATSLGSGSNVNEFKLASASSQTGTDAIGFVSDPSRASAISRDSERQALQAAAAESLKQQAEAASAVRSEAITSLAHTAELQAAVVAKNLWHLPTEGYTLTARFGMTSGLWATFHTGLDFAAPTGTPIYAVANGVITDTGVAGAYGNRTIETLTDGTEIWYAHQSAINVKVGDVVTGGQVIGRVGSTGNTTGPHVHIEVRPGGGDPVDPFKAFTVHGVTP